jgi:signal transduction histidine kinase
LSFRNLTESEERYRLVFENSPIPIWEEDFSGVKGFFNGLRKEGVVDLNIYLEQNPDTLAKYGHLARVINMNQAAVELHKAENKQHLLDNLSSLFTPDFLDSFRKEWIGLWNGKTEMIFDSTLKTFTGDIRTVSVYFTVCPGHEETFSRIFAFVVDLSERVETEAELAGYREHLEELVQARTAELETANSELEAFAYSISHDLRAPLRHISGFVSLLENKAGGGFDDKGRYYMRLISDAAGKMGQLIDDLLSFSRLGRQSMSFIESGLEDVVDDIIRDQKTDTLERKVVWHIDELPMVYCDISMLRIVLNNLVSNAVKFTRPRKEAVIEIGSYTEEDGVVVFVRDNGVGFDPKYTDKLFGVFHRLHLAEEFEGTGVGLAIAHRIIQRHGGRIWAEGELDKGATFYFSLPIDNGGGSNRG